MMINDHPFVSVIIVNWNGRAFISKCLEGLRGQSYRNFQTIVVDNGSTDGSVEFLARGFTDLDLIRLSCNTGFSKANNIAIRRIKTPYVALLNNDAVPEPQWLECLVAALETYPEAGMAASKMVYWHDPDRIDRAGDAYTMAGAGSLRGRGKPSHAYDVDEWIFGASAGAALYRTDLFKEVGLFDEDFFLLYEDVDLSFRAQLAGYRCRYVPNAVVRHMATRSIGYDSPVSVYYGHRNLEWTYIKNMPTRLILKTLPFHLVYEVASLGYFAVTGRAAVYLQSKWDALKGLHRSLLKRKSIQTGRRVSDAYVQGLLSREFLGDRLLRRLRRGTAIGHQGKDKP